MNKMCPFCGNKNLDQARHRHDDMSTYHTTCPRCGACGPVVGSQAPGCHAAQAIDNWNKRAPTATVLQANRLVTTPLISVQVTDPLARAIFGLAIALEEDGALIKDHA